jgi:hypothetical protein
VRFQFENSAPDDDVTMTSDDTMTQGRPSCSYEEASSRTKRRKSSTLRDNYNVLKLSHATEMSFRASGSKDAAKILKDMRGDPSTASKYLQHSSGTKEVEMSAGQALALLVDQKLTKSQYNGIRDSSLQCGSKLYPSYHTVLEAKKDCYPRILSDISVCETCAEIKLQSLLNLTTERLVLTQQDVLNHASLNDIEDLQLIYKWGWDGTSTENNFKQKFANDDGTKTDAHIFFTSLVPLQLYAINDATQEKIIVWKNPRPASPWFCRPIKIEFLKETPETTRLEVGHIKEQAKNPIPYKTSINRKNITVKYELVLTMIDAKVCNPLATLLYMWSNIKRL